MDVFYVSQDQIDRMLFKRNAKEIKKVLKTFIQYKECENFDLDKGYGHLQKIQQTIGRWNLERDVLGKCLLAGFITQEFYNAYIDFLNLDLDHEKRFVADYTYRIFKSIS